MYESQSVTKINTIIKFFISKPKVFNFLILFLIIILTFYSLCFLVFSYSLSNCISDRNNTAICKISQGCLSNPFEISAKAEYKLIDGQQCTQFKKYLPELQKSALKYSSPKLELNEYIIAGIISRESKFGSLTNGCDGYGDDGNGHGIAQIDGRHSNPRLPPNGGQGTKVKYTTTKYGQEEFSWSSCIDSIYYIGAYLMNSASSVDALVTDQLRKANLNTELDSNGSFKDPKSKNAYLRQTLNSYNSGPSLITPIGNCTIQNNGSVNDSCTSQKDYSEKVLAKALEFIECLGNKADKKIVDSLTSTDNSNQKLLQCLNNNSSQKSLAIAGKNIQLKPDSNSNEDINTLITQNKIPYNIDYTDNVNLFFSINVGQTLPVPPPEINTPGLNGQCVSLVKQWQVFIGGVSSAWGANYPLEAFNDGYMKGNKLMAQDNNKFTTFGFRTVNALRAGDLVMLDPSSSPSSHTGIATGVIDNNQFEILDQNWDGNHGPSRKSKYSNSTFVGAIRYIKK
jgi:hypothetical protein